MLESGDEIYSLLSRRIAVQPYHLPPSSIDDELKITNARFYENSYKRLFPDYTEGTREIHVCLLPEPENEYDRFALAITYNDILIGHIPAAVNKKYWGPITYLYTSGYYPIAKAIMYRESWMSYPDLYLHVGPADELLKDGTWTILPRKRYILKGLVPANTKQKQYQRTAPVPFTVTVDGVDYSSHDDICNEQPTTGSKQIRSASAKAPAKKTKDDSSPIIDFLVYCSENPKSKQAKYLRAAMIAAMLLFFFVFVF